jgi:hypothetical protein
MTSSGSRGWPHQSRLRKSLLFAKDVSGYEPAAGIGALLVKRLISGWFPPRSRDAKQNAALPATLPIFLAVLSVRTGTDE